MHDIQRRLTGCALLGVLLLVSGCAPSEEPAEPQAKAGGVAATIGDRTITLEELDEQAQSSNMNAYQALYDARNQALQQMIERQVVEAAAAARGVSVEEMVRLELDKRVTPVTATEVESFYNQQKARMQGQSLDELRDQIEGFLARQKAVIAQQQFFKELRDQVAVQVMLDPPRVEIVVAQTERIKGPDTAKVTIVEYSDFQ